VHEVSELAHLAMEIVCEHALCLHIGKKERTALRNGVDLRSAAFARIEIAALGEQLQVAFERLGARWGSGSERDRLVELLGRCRLLPERSQNVVKHSGLLVLIE
jgi:hypothetical protein